MLTTKLQTIQLNLNTTQTTVRATPPSRKLFVSMRIPISFNETRNVITVLMSEVFLWYCSF
jgi:hypothetical protein